MRIIPAIDIREGRVVRLKQGRLTEITSHGPDAIAVAKRWESEGAPLLHIVDLDGAFDAKPQIHLIEKIIGAVKIPVEVGGGIRAVETASRYVRAGASRVIFGTAAVRDEAVVQKAVELWPDTIAIAIDAKDGIVQVSGWNDTAKVRVHDLLDKLSSWRTPRIQLTDIVRKGLKSEPNIAAIQDVASHFRGLVTIAGGVSSHDDLEALRKVSLSSSNVDEVIVGKALYDGRVTLTGAPGVSIGPTAEIPRPKRT